MRLLIEGNYRWVDNEFNCVVWEEIVRVGFCYCYE